MTLAKPRDDDPMTDRTQPYRKSTRKDHMTRSEPHSQPGQHPARIDSLIEALRATDAGEGVAEGLEFLFDHAPAFELHRVPSDEWDYVKMLVWVLIDSPEVSAHAFGDPNHAFMAGVEMAQALAMHTGSPLTP